MTTTRTLARRANLGPAAVVGAIVVEVAKRNWMETDPTRFAVQGHRRDTHRLFERGRENGRGFHEDHYRPFSREVAHADLDVSRASDLHDCQVGTLCKRKVDDGRPVALGVLRLETEEGDSS